MITHDLLELTKPFSVAATGPRRQLPLLGFVHLDDLCLEQTPEARWFHLLRRYDRSAYHGTRCGYYNALRVFNRAAADEAALRLQQRPPNPETKEEARQRLLFERPTMGNEEVPLVYLDGTPKTATQRVAPPVVGRAPKDFDAQLKSFIGVALMGDEPEPEVVHRHLTSNPTFARVCGFTWPHPSGAYRQSDIPSLRKLEQFDQIMTQSGLWKDVKLIEIKKNVDTGVIKVEDTLVHDTTHLHAHSSFETVEYETKGGKTEKKSAPKPTKRCGCEDKKNCPHAWEYADPGAGTVVKAGGRMYWAHKVSVLSLGRQGIVVDAFPVTDASTHDGLTVVPSLERLYEDHPYVKDWFSTLLDDGAADDKKLKEVLREEFGLRLVCSLNPRARKVVTEGLGRGVKEIRPNGEVVCMAGHCFDYLGIRFAGEVFNFGPPQSEEGMELCSTCPQKAECCPHAEKGRHVTIPFDLLPQIDPNDPQLSKRFKAMLARRTSIERGIKRIKCDLGGDTLTKRGNAACQARLDKTLIAYHMLLRDCG